jgi:hypothetical protein
MLFVTNSNDLSQALRKRALLEQDLDFCLSPRTGMDNSLGQVRFQFIPDLFS